jgi:hypothetical protein
MCEWNFFRGSVNMDMAGVYSLKGWGSQYILRLDETLWGSSDDGTVT